MGNERFTGDKKAPMTTLLAPYERRFIDSSVHRFPLWLQGWHLTLMTILWSAGTVLFGYLAAEHNNLHWLWLSSLMLFMQWFTDCFDGALGRSRDTGIPKWGYYMDHLLDYVFTCSILIGYSFLLDGFPRQIVYCLIPVFSCFMVSAYLAFSATGEFKITYMGAGPTEIRIWFIILNTVLIIFGAAWIKTILPYILIASVIVLCIVVYRTQKYIWKIDMQDKAARQHPPRPGDPVSNS